MAAVNGERELWNPKFVGRSVGGAFDVKSDRIEDLCQHGRL